MILAGNNSSFFSTILFYQPKCYICKAVLVKLQYTASLCLPHTRKMDDHLYCIDAYGLYAQNGRFKMNVFFCYKHRFTSIYSG